jgi:hypothetical protein
MIHRSFLSESFSNPAFAFNRRTCLAAFKTIIKEYKSVVVEDGPVWWIHQAFSVAAAIILILDVLHGDPAEAERAEHRNLAEDVVGILTLCQNSMIASRGVKLLGALLAEVKKTRKRARDGSLLPPDNKFDVPCFVMAFCEDKSTAAASAKNKQPNQIRQAKRASPPRTPSLSDDPPPGYYNGNEQQQEDLLDFTQEADFNFSFPPAGRDGT